MPLRAIDFHVHLPTPDWLDGSMAGYVEAAEAYFRSSAQRQSLGELAARYRGLELKAVLLAWDAETATGRPRVPNETVAAACRDYPDVFTGLGSVDPHKGSAVAEVAEIDIGGQTITDRSKIQPLVEGLNDCHWFFPTHGAGADRRDFWLRLKSGSSYGFFVANEYGKQAILVFTEPGRGIKPSHGYAASPRLLGAMRDFFPSS